jgi:hypothetical protein
VEKNFEALVVTARGAVRERVIAKVAPRRALPIVAMVKGLMSPADEISIQIKNKQALLSSAYVSMIMSSVLLSSYANPLREKRDTILLSRGSSQSSSSCCSSSVIIKQLL